MEQLVFLHDTWNSLHVFSHGFACACVSTPWKCPRYSLGEPVLIGRVLGEPVLIGQASSTKGPLGEPLNHFHSGLHACFKAVPAWRSCSVPARHQVPSAHLLTSACSALCCSGVFTSACSARSALLTSACSALCLLGTSTYKRLLGTVPARHVYLQAPAQRLLGTFT